MPKRSSKKRDLNLLVAGIVESAAEGPQPTQEAEPGVTEDGKNPHAVALGRIGGRKGGPARAKKLAAEERSRIAREAARTRWHGRQSIK